MSGLSHTPGKRARGKTLRGFESRLLRQINCAQPLWVARLFLSKNTQGGNMKMFVKLASLGLIAISQNAWADSGPYYVRFAGFCDVKKVYVTASNDIYGTEVGCSASIGQPQLGYLGPKGDAIVTSPASSGRVCMEFFYTNGTTSMTCSNGTKMEYFKDSPYTVKPSSVSEAPKSYTYTISDEMPDLEKSKDLPSRY